jgi:hypothetical protein
MASLLNQTRVQNLLRRMPVLHHGAVHPHFMGFTSSMRSQLISEGLNLTEALRKTTDAATPTEHDVARLIDTFERQLLTGLEWSTLEIDFLQRHRDQTILFPEADNQQLLFSTNIQALIIGPPGTGWGTFNRIFEAFVNVQTRQSLLYPIIVLDGMNRPYETLHTTIQTIMLKPNFPGFEQSLVSPGDFELFRIIPIDPNTPVIDQLRTVLPTYLDPASWPEHLGWARSDSPRTDASTPGGIDLRWHQPPILNRQPVVRDVTAELITGGTHN